jgi:hypothetical protein
MKHEHQQKREKELDGRNELSSLKLAQIVSLKCPRMTKKE